MAPKRRKDAKTKSGGDRAGIEALVGSLKDIAYFKGPDGRFAAVNQAFADLMEKTPSELIGLRGEDCLPPDINETCCRAEDEAARSRKPIQIDINLPHKDGPKTIHSLKIPVADADGKPLGTLAICRDAGRDAELEEERGRHLAREQSLRREAEDANRAKDEFLALLSHELRTPMTAMMGWIWLLRSKNLDSQEAADALDTIERNMNLQSQIIEDMLDLSRIVTGKMRLEPRVIELGPILLAASEVVLPAARARSIELRIPEKLPRLRVLGDPERLQQVFWNLISNGVKYTEPGGKVSMELKLRGKQAVVSVRDSGVGIPPKYLEHVFDPFSQSENPLTREHGGLGLGLAIVHQIVELHGGTVAVESDGRGKGSKFSVSFPTVPAKGETALGAAPPAFPPATPEEEPLEKLTGVRVLIVEDDDDTRAMLRATLEICGAHVASAASAREAFDVFQQDPPDVLLLDLAMPQEDGYSLLKRIRELGPENGGDVPAAALTAMTRAEDRAKTLRSGFQIYLPKPVEPGELSAVVKSLTK